MQKSTGTAFLLLVPLISLLAKQPMVQLSVMHLQIIPSRSPRVWRSKAYPGLSLLQVSAKRQLFIASSKPKCVYFTDFSALNCFFFHYNPVMNTVNSLSAAGSQSNLVVSQPTDSVAIGNPVPQPDALGKPGFYRSELTKGSRLI